MTLINSLPEDLIIDCISRVPRRHYPKLSLVSKYFRSLITSHELYARRVLLDRTENCLYVTISKSDSNDGDDRLYTLRQNFNSPDNKYSLVPVSSLPGIPPRGSYVAVDSKIFVIPDDESLSSTDTLLIDCRFHTAHHVPSMPNEVDSPVYKYSNVREICIKGWKLGSRSTDIEGVVMFVKNQDKSVRNTQIPQTLVGMCQWNYSSTMTWVSFMTPKTTDDIINLKAWYDNEFFLDGVFYAYCPFSRRLTAFGLKQRYLKFVKGVELMTDEDIDLARTVIYGGKVVVFLQKKFDEKNEIWCAEIKVKSDEEGELCGRVEWCGCVLEGQWPTLKNSLVVKV